MTDIDVKPLKKPQESRSGRFDKEMVPSASGSLLEGAMTPFENTPSRMDPPPSRVDSSPRMDPPPSRMDSSPRMDSLPGVLTSEKYDTSDEDHSERILEQALEPIYVRTFSECEESYEEFSNSLDMNLTEQSIQEATSLGSASDPPPSEMATGAPPVAPPVRSWAGEGEGAGGVSPLDELDEEEDEVITFAAPPHPPTAVVAKPLQTGVPSVGAGRLRSLSMNGHLTLNLSPQNAAPKPDLSSPSMGRFKVTTCQSEAELTNRSPKDQLGDPETPPPPQPKDERLLTPLERLQLYAENPTLSCRNGVAVQYVNFIRDAEDPEVFLAFTARVFERLTQDPDAGVRLAFLEQVPNIVRSYKPAFKKLHIMSFIGESIRDDNYNIRRVAQMAIGQLIEFSPELMTRDTIAASIVPILVQMFINVDCSADLAIDALNIFCKLLDKVGPEPVKKLFIPEFNKLATHEVGQIRQVCATNMALVVKYFAVTQAEEFTETDEYCRAVQDKVVALAQDAAWHVRESIVTVFPQMIEICHKRWPVFSQRALYPAYLHLLNDQAKQVRRCATRGLGRAIASSADFNKTRLQITPAGTVEFIPPASFPFSRFSESEDSDHRMSPLLSEGHHRMSPLSEGHRSEGHFETRRGRPPTRPATHPTLTPANILGHPRRSYYNRLGITSLNHALSDMDLSATKKEEHPDYNSFQFWQHPIPEVAVGEDAVILLKPVAPVDSSSGDLQKGSLPEAKEPNIELPSMDDEFGLGPDEEVVRSELEKLVAFAEQNSVQLEASLQPPPNEDSPPKEPPPKEQIPLIVEPSAPQPDDTSPSEVEISEPKDATEKTDGKKDRLSALIDSDDTHSDDSSTQDFVTFTTLPPPATMFSTSYDIDSYIVEKHKRREKAILLQLKDAGEISSTLEEILPNVVFLKEFVTLARDPDRETVIQTAVDFPAVAFTIGRQFWPEIQECHRSLASCAVIPARELIAASLPRIAEIIGYYYTVVDLVPLINEFLKDTDTVRLAMIENYSSFIMRMPPEIRPAQLLRLCEFFPPDEERNWRYRYACAEQIAHLALLFPPKLVVRNLMDGAWSFARDRTCEVRRSSCLALSSIFQRIEQQRDLHSRSIFLQKLELFLRNRDFRSRQVFAQICEDLLSKAALSFDSFSSSFGDRFWPLFEDNVVAVRLAAARCLVHIPQQGRKQSNYAKALEKLQRDSSRTIQEVYQEILAQSAN